MAARVLVIDERYGLAELLEARLGESRAVESCLRAPQQQEEDGFGGLMSGGYAGLVEEHRLDTIVYAPPPRARRQATPDLSEAEVVFQQCARAGVRQFVLLSSAAIYGASPHNTGFATESRMIARGDKNQITSRWLDLEALAVSYFETAGARLTILRPAPVLAHGGADYLSRLFKHSLAPALPGHDPSLQLLSPEDLSAAVRCAVERGAAGIYNVAPDGVIPLRAALRLAGARRLPIARTLQRLARAGLAPAGLAHTVEQLEYVRYSSTVSNEKIKRELGFAPRHSSAGAVSEFAAANKEGGGKPPFQTFETGSLEPFKVIPRSREEGLAPASTPQTHSVPPSATSSDEFDDFGMDKDYIAAYGRTLFRFLHDRYWRVEVEGLRHVPREGRAVLVGVHRGFMPWDAVMLLHLLVRETGRYPRFLIHPGLIKFPFLFNFHTKLGGIVACQENADYVLRRDELLAIYPEGIRGAFTMYRDAYKLQKFGRDDFVKMALRNRAPIVPFVNVGAAEIFPIIGKLNWGWWKRRTEWPFLPITPTFPLLPPVPLPSKWHTQFLAPVHVEERYPPEAADDARVVRDISREVKRRMEEAMREILSRRKSIFFGTVFEEKPGHEETAYGRKRPDETVAGLTREGW